METICQAGRLLLENGKSFEDLIEDTYDQIRMIFDINYLLKNEGESISIISEQVSSAKAQS